MTGKDKKITACAGACKALGPGLRRGDTELEKEAVAPEGFSPGPSDFAFIRPKLLADILKQIPPIRIHSLNQSDFPFAVPSLDQLFPGNGADDVGMNFIPDQMMDAVLVGESGLQAIPVLPCAPHQITGDARIENPIPLIGQQINVVVGHFLRPWIYARWYSSHWAPA